MKFKSIDTERSYKGHIVVKTEPTLSQTLFDHVRGLFPPDVKVKFSNGDLIIEANAISADDVKYYEGFISNAERNLKREDDKAKADHEGWLDDLSDESGLPLE